MLLGGASVTGNVYLVEAANALEINEGVATFHFHSGLDVLP